MKLDVKRLRQDVDERSRLGFYGLSKLQGVLLYERDVANAIYNEFASKHKTANLTTLMTQLSSSTFNLTHRNAGKS